jgi:hypothetical protein
MTWALANNPGSPTYNGAFPTSSTPILYTAQQASQLASFNQFAAMRNAANYQYFLFGSYLAPSPPPAAEVYVFIHTMEITATNTHPSCLRRALVKQARGSFN